MFCVGDVRNQSERTYSTTLQALLVFTSLGKPVMLSRFDVTDEVIAYRRRHWYVDSQPFHAYIYQYSDIAYPAEL